ncbi:alpha/beta hydrolase [Sedimentitalea todarodis]|uniref:Alpha/beta hydrolase n=1 Tax=Sedimentitalea todarodis TaxID=1631240 RepID=A0ABU3VF54_9RHOB|nr:alpha/beta hydrolase [Sedimentitalea todarodis]MDU9004808.1 alpha/beta hydrolase [Sedimentitalea todarodis]
MIATVRVFATLVLCIGLLSCTRPPDLIGIDNGTDPVLSVNDASRQKVFIATTREATEAIGVFYSGERAPDLGLSSVVVSIPPSHQSGMIERPKRLPPDPRTEFSVIEPAVYGSSNAFVAGINAELARRAPQDRDVLLFIHGYNNTFSDSVLRIAQFVEDTNFSGVPVLFSWASAGKASHYVYDMNSALAARPQLLKTARILASTRAQGFDLFAHSMGSLLTVEALVEASLVDNTYTLGRMDNVMFAAPDIDLDLFKSQLNRIPKTERDFYVFVSKDDRALMVSRRISGGVARVGAADAAELSNLGVSVIDLSEIGDSASGTHSKFAGSPAVVQLIGSSLKKDNFDSKVQPPTLVEVLNDVPVIRVLVPD